MLSRQINCVLALPVGHRSFHALCRHLLLLNSCPVLEPLHLLKQRNCLTQIVCVRADIRKLDLGQVGLIAHRFVSLVFYQLFAKYIVDGS